MRVHEYRDIGQVVKVLDDIGEVGHSLVAFVCRAVVEGGLVVRRVDGKFQVVRSYFVAKIGDSPAHILIARGSDDQGSGAISSRSITCLCVCS